MGPTYCPAFSDYDFIYGDYESKIHSWYRLAIHFCDPEERKLQDKKCESRDDIETYMQQVLVSMKTIGNKASLRNFD